MAHMGDGWGTHQLELAHEVEHDAEAQRDQGHQEHHAAEDHLLSKWEFPKIRGT